MANLKIDIAAEFTGAKAFKKAETSTDKLNKSVKKLGGALAAAFSAQAIAEFGKASVKAFLEDEKAATRLAKVVDNLGLSFANPVISSFIDKLSLATGVTDDQLRPAFQALLTTTGDVIDSQRLLKESIDISAGSGIALETVAQDLAQAYVGNLKGLKKYNLGLSQAQLKSKSFTEIQKLLNAQFSGSNAAYLDTYAGKMQLLNTAAGEAQETIGKGLVDALLQITGNTSIEDLAADMQAFATEISNVVTALGGIIAKFKGLQDSMPGWLKTILYSDWTPGRAGLGVLKFLGNLGEKEANKNLPNPSVQMFLTDQANSRLERENANKQKKNTEKIVAATKANTAELKKQAVLKKLQGLFDLEQIQRVAALKGKLTEEDAKKVRLQLALLQGNEYEAKKLTEEIANSIDSTGKLAESLRTLPDAKNPFAAWRGYLDEIELQAMRVASYAVGNGAPRAIAPVIGGSLPIPSTNAEGIAGGNNVIGFNRFGVETGGNQTIKIDLNVDGKLLAQVLQDASLNGNQVYVNRITGGFYQ